MHWTFLLSYLFGGACLTNAVPHLVSGLTGHSFPSLFSKPVGVGLSSAIVNFLWGWANLLIGYVLVVRVGDFDLRSTVDVSTAALGSLVIGLMLASHFAKLFGSGDSR